MLFYTSDIMNKSVKNTKLNNALVSVAQAQCTQIVFITYKNIFLFIFVIECYSHRNKSYIFVDDI